MFAKPNPGIKTIRSQIDQAIIQHRFDPNIGVAVKELTQDRIQVSLGRVFDRCYSDCARWFVPKFAKRGNARVQLGKGGAERLQQPLARFGGGNTSGRPSE